MATKRISKRASLTPFQVRKIREQLAKGQNQEHIAAKFHISQSAVSNIARGKTYRGVE